MFSIVPSYKEEFLACVDVFVRLLYMYKLHTRKNNSYGIINGCLSFYLNCCALSFPLNVFMFWQFRP